MRRPLGSLLLLAMALPVHAEGLLESASLRLDNDILSGTDRDYSNGIGFGAATVALEGFQDARLPALVRGYNGATRWLQPAGDRVSMDAYVRHALYTPGDKLATSVIEDDRPYAGALLLGTHWNATTGDRLLSTTLEVGMVGPSARAYELQRAAHHVFGSEEFQGWKNQLRDEPVLRLALERADRREWRDGSDGGWQQDLVTRVGGNVGNLVTDANAGVEWRFGGYVPDDFGSAPGLPGTTVVAPGSSHARDRGFHAHGFVVLEARAVARDITLDGNSWKDSHSVDRRPFVGTLGLGIAMSWRAWSLAIAQYQMSKEFDGQPRAPRIGSLTLRRAL